MNSLETGHWIEEEPYELSDAYPSAQVSKPVVCFFMNFIIELL